MRVGDLLEWLAGAAFVGGAYLATTLAWPAVLVGGAFLIYQAQCHGTTPFPKVQRPGWLRIPRRAGKKRDQ